MDEREWLTSTEPQAMLAFLRDSGKLSEFLPGHSGREGRRALRRKLRLFTCACHYSLRDLPVDEASRRAVEVAERFADGLAEIGTLAEARLACRRADGTRPRIGREAVAWCSVSENVWIAAPEAASETAWWADAQPVEGGGWRMGDPQATRRWLAALLRDLVFNPFRPPPSLHATLRTWNGGLVPRLAQAAYEDRVLPEGTLDSARLAVLADALEESGLADAALVEHLRSGGPHVRGCHVVDAALGKG